MAPKPRIFVLDDTEYTVNDLAEKRGCTPANMHRLIRKHGFPKAMYVEQRKSNIHEKLGTPKVAMGFNPKLERWRRVKAWVDSGMSIEEIRIKDRMI